MATDIKLGESQVTVEAFGFKVVGADLLLDWPERRGGAGGDLRRALVHGFGDALVINWARDYTGGVYLNGRVFALDDITAPVQSWPTNLRGTSGRLEPLTAAPSPPQPVPIGEELTRLRRDIGLLRELVEVLNVRASITADAAHYTQRGWAWCSKCSSLHFFPNASRSVCPADRQPHAFDPNSTYTLFPNKSRYVGQPGWAWCNKCQSLNYGVTPQSGHCPTGGAHDRTDSPGYLLHTTDMQGPGVARDFNAQDNWRWCNRCYGLFHASAPGVCPAPGGGPHNGGGSFNYWVQW